MPIRFADDDDRYIDFIYQPVRNDAGDVVGTFAGGYDVTVQVRAKQALLEANRTLEDRVAVALADQARTEEALTRRRRWRRFAS